MKKLSILILYLLAMGTISGCSLFSSEKDNAKVADETGLEDKIDKKSKLLIVDNDGNTKIDPKVMATSLALNVKTPLSESEVLGIKFMLEEEKLARDVNAKFFEIWNQAIFDDNSSGDHTHIGSIKELAEKYDIDFDFYNNKLGAFSNTHLKELFNDSVTKGSSSTVEALKISALIEETCLLDLEKYLKETRNDDIRLVYENLEKASRNHFRNIVKTLLREGEAYEAQVIEKGRFEKIMSTQYDNNN